MHPYRRGKDVAAHAKSMHAKSMHVSPRLGAHHGPAGSATIALHSAVLRRPAWCA